MSGQEPPIYAGKPLIPPTEILKGQAPMSPAEALAFLEQSRRDPAGYWAGIAQELEWFSPWERTLEGSFPSFRFSTSFVPEIVSSIHRSITISRFSQN